MSDEKKETKPLTGRTAWDFAAEVTQRLGLSILILIGIAFGFYQYQNQALKFKKAEQESNKDLQDKLNSAHKQLVDSAVAVGQLNKNMIDNIKSGLGELQGLRDSIKVYQEQTKVEAQKTEDAIAKQKEAEEATVRAKNNLEKVKSEQERLQKLRIAKSGPFRDKVKSLISLLSDIIVDDPNIVNLTTEIRQDYLVDPLALFQAVAKNPNVENLEKLRELEGFKYDAIMNILKDNKADFAAWMLVREEGKEHADVVVGVVRGAEKKIFGLVLIEFDDKERIWDIEGHTNFFFLVHPDVLNWDDYITTAISFESTGDWDGDEFYEVPSGWPQERMNLSGIILGLNESDRKYEIQVLAGENLSIMPITLDELQSEEPKIYGEFLEEDDYPLEKIQMMVRKSKTFSAAPLVPIALGRDQKNIGNLRLTIIQTLDAAVRRDDEKRQNLAKENFPKSNWGHLASVALNKFAVHELTPSTDGLEASVACSFQDYETGDILTARINFRREQAVMKSPWRIAGFVELQPEPRQSALQKAY